MDSLLRGLRLMRGASMVCAAAIGAFLLASLVAVIAGLSANTFPSDTAWTICVVVCLGAAGVIWPRGVRLVTTPEEPVRASARHESLRRWSRGAGRLQMPAITAVAAVLVIEWMPLPGGWWAAPGAAIGAVIMLCAGVIVAVQLVTVPWFLRELAARVPSRGLMSSARTTMIVAVLALAGIGLQLFGSTHWVIRVITFVPSLAALALPILMTLLFVQSVKEVARVRERRRDAGHVPDAS